MNKPILFAFLLFCSVFAVSSPDSSSVKIKAENYSVEPKLNDFAILKLQVNKLSAQVISLEKRLSELEYRMKPRVEPTNLK
jgi:hypothetical protein